MLVLSNSYKSAAFGVKGLQLGSSGSTYWITPFFNGAAPARLAAVAAPELTVSAAEDVGTEHDAAVPPDKESLRGRQGNLAPRSRIRDSARPERRSRHQ